MPVAGIYFAAKIFDHFIQIEWQEGFSIGDIRIEQGIVEGFIRAVGKGSSGITSVADRFSSESKVPQMRLRNRLFWSKLSIMLRTSIVIGKACSAHCFEV
jgi:hypothetical protein